MNGARLWVHVGALRFQPGELAKIMLIVFLAGVPAREARGARAGTAEGLGPLLVIWGGAMLVLLETNDLGSGLLYFGIFLAMLYVATARFAYVAAGLGLFLVGAVRRLESDAARARPRDDLAPSVDRAQGLLPAIRGLDLRQNCQSFQLVKSLYSIANGGYGGTGLGKGTFTQPSTDTRSSPTSTPTSSTPRSRRSSG